MITPKERIIKVFNKEIVDRPPCICPGGMMNMITTELMDKVNNILAQGPFKWRENGTTC